MKLREIGNEFPCFENSKFGKGKLEEKYRCRIYMKFYTTEKDSKSRNIYYKILRNSQ